MRGSSVVFLLLIPALVALGHDIYLFYTNYAAAQGFSVDLLLKEFKFSAFGFIWTTYDEAGYKNFVASVDAPTWATVDYLLTFRAFYTGLGFAGVFIVLFLALALFGIGPFAAESARTRSSDKNANTSFRSGQGSKKMLYKRK